MNRKLAEIRVLDASYISRNSPNFPNHCNDTHRFNRLRTSFSVLQ